MNINFFDDTRLYMRKNLTRDYGKAELVETKVSDIPEWGYGWPIGHWQEEDGTWYMPVTMSRHVRMGTVGQNLGTYYVGAMFKSTDGENWQPDERAEKFGIENPVVPNQFFECGDNEEMGYVYYDKDDVPARRYKMLALRINHDDHWVNNIVYCSANAFNWRIMDGAIWSCRGPEPGVSVFRIEEKHTNGIVLRPTWGDRRVGIATTENFYSFTPPQLKLQPDSIDPPDVEFYGMRVKPYKGTYVGLLWQYHTPESTFNKFWGGKIDCQLAYSLNGLDWFRSLRKPFIATGPEGSVDGGMTNPGEVIEMPDGSLRIYGSATRIEHPGRYNDSVQMDYSDQSVITKYKLREDGFIKLVAGNEEALLATRPILLEGAFDINIVCADKATCAVYDNGGKKVIPGFAHEDCVPFTGDNTHWTPKWKEHDMAELAGKAVCIQIKLTNGELYAINGAVTPITVHEAIHYVRRGVTLDVRGF